MPLDVILSGAERSEESRPELPACPNFALRVTPTYNVANSLVIRYTGYASLGYILRSSPFPIAA